MALTKQQKLSIRGYFRLEYIQSFGDPSLREEDRDANLSPNEHIMVLQWIKCHLLNIKIEPLSNELLTLKCNDYTVQQSLQAILYDKLSPINPDNYLTVMTNFKLHNHPKTPATAKDIKEFLVNVIEEELLKMHHPYLKEKSDPQKKQSLVPVICKSLVLTGIGLLGMFALKKHMSKEESTANSGLSNRAQP